MYAKPLLGFACLLLMDFDLVHCTVLSSSEADAFVTYTSENQVTASSINCRCPVGDGVFFYF